MKRICFATGLHGINREVEREVFAGWPVVSPTVNSPPLKGSVRGDSAISKTLNSCQLLGVMSSLGLGDIQRRGKIAYGQPHVWARQASPFPPTEGSPFLDCGIKVLWHLTRSRKVTKCRYKICSVREAMIFELFIASFFFLSLNLSSFLFFFFLFSRLLRKDTFIGLVLSFCILNNLKKKS